MKTKPNSIAIVLAMMLIFLVSCGETKTENSVTNSKPPKTENSVTNSKPEQKRISQGPSTTELQKVDGLIDQNKYDDAFNELIRLRGRYEDTADLKYRGIKAMVLQVKWANTLKGEERTSIMNKIVKRDFAGLICVASGDYIKTYDSSDQYYDKVKAVHEIAKRSMKDRPCEHSPMEQFDAQAFVVRMESAANLIRELESFTF